MGEDTTATATATATATTIATATTTTTTASSSLVLSSTTVGGGNQKEQLKGQQQQQKLSDHYPLQQQQQQQQHSNTTTTSSSKHNNNNNNNTNSSSSNNNNNNKTSSSGVAVEKVLPRSARLRHPIVAPGFGTQRDLERLSTDLGQPIKVIQAIMSSKGRGYRRRGSVEPQEENNSNKTPVTNNAWAAFLTEAADTNETTTKKEEEEESKTTSKRSRRSTTTKEEEEKQEEIASSADDTRRVYDLSCLKLNSTSSEPQSKKAKKTDTATTNSGVLAQSGTLDSASIGRSGLSKVLQSYDLIIPTLLFPLSSTIRFTKVISSSNAVHALALTDDGKLYGWGRNEMNQLGSGTGIEVSTVISRPTLLTVDNNNNSIVDAAVGKHHTIILDGGGHLYAAGGNKLGQCAINRQTQEMVTSFRKCIFQDEDESINNISQIACGESFSIALDDEGRMWSAGSSEFGTLGNGETGEYFIAANKLGFANSFQFARRRLYAHAPNEKLHSNSKAKVEPMLGEQDIRFAHVACGKHHAIAVEAPSQQHNTRVFSWGCGNYGCLGHGVQADEFRPRVVGFFSNEPHKASMWRSNPPVEVAAGASCSLVRTRSGHVYYMGKHKTNTDAVMRPSLLAELAHNSHVVAHMDAGSQSVAVSTKNAVTILWGQGPHGELGFGSKKSSAKPDFCSALDSCRISSLACGYGNTYYVVTKEDAEDDAAIEKLNIVDDNAYDELDKNTQINKKKQKEKSSTTPGKKKGSNATPGKKKK